MSKEGKFKVFNEALEVALLLATITTAGLSLEATLNQIQNTEAYNKLTPQEKLDLEYQYEEYNTHEGDVATVYGIATAAGVGAIAMRKK